jgi:beta-glucosidase
VVDVNELLGRMTLDEKVAQLGAAWFLRLVDTDGQLDPAACQRRLGRGIGHITRIAGDSGLPAERAAEMANAIQRFCVTETRLGIPAIVHEEALAGVLALGATQFPQAIGLASTWDTDLVEEVGAALRGELLALGVRQALSPVLDIARDPRWGRLEETYGEDPYLVSRLGVAYVRGMQGDDLRHGVAATAKHFVAYGIPEGGFNHAPAVVGPRLLRDVFAAPFRAAIAEAGLASVMAAYNEVDGLACHGAPELLDELLRGELGFDGVVVADYWGLQLLTDWHRVAADSDDQAVLGLGAGVDVELPTMQAYQRIPALVEHGRVPEEWVDRSCRRVLQLKADLGLFDDPYVPTGPEVGACFDTPASRELARRAAASSIVVLTNDGTLPLRPGLRVALLGPTADDARLQLGDYHYPAHIEVVHDPDAVFGSPVSGGRPFTPPLEAVPMSTVRSGLEALGVELECVRGCDVTGDERSGLEPAVTAAAQADVAVVCVGGKSGLTRDATSGEFRDASHLGLTGVQSELVAAVAATGTPTVVVAIGGRAHALTDVADHASALVMAWLPGEEGGAALADVLTGRVEPSGRLPVSLLRHSGQVGVRYDHHHGAGRSQFLGDYIDGPATAHFAFGHGLSYTRVAYRDLDVTVTADGGLEIGCVVANEGDRRGIEVVQLYLRDEMASVGRPQRALAGFARVPLDPGASAQVRFGVDAGRLGFHDSRLEYVVEPGACTVLVGASSADIRLEATVEIGGERRSVDPNAVRPTRAVITPV